MVLWLIGCCFGAKKCIDTVSLMLLMTSDEILGLSVYPAKYGLDFPKLVLEASVNDYGEHINGFFS